MCVEKGESGESGEALNPDLWVYYWMVDELLGAQVIALKHGTFTYIHLADGDFLHAGVYMCCCVDQIIIGCLSIYPVESVVTNPQSHILHVFSE